ncbi:Hypothetical protein FKW44_007540, partial [Caligus rogercresseyi]
MASGTVTNISPNPRSYSVTTENGNTIRRNRGEREVADTPSNSCEEEKSLRYLDHLMYRDTQDYAKAFPEINIRTCRRYKPGLYNIEQ